MHYVAFLLHSRTLSNTSSLTVSQNALIYEYFYLSQNTCVSKYSYSIAEYLHYVAFLPHNRKLANMSILTVWQDTFIYEYLLPYCRTLAYKNILTVSQSTCICKCYYSIAEYFHIRVFLPHSRILANMSIFTISQNACIHKYSYRMTEYLHIRILLPYSRIIVYASILRHHTASTGKYSSGFSEKHADILRLYIDQGSASFCTFKIPILFGLLRRQTWELALPECWCLPIKTASFPRRIKSSEYHAWIFRWLSTDLPQSTCQFVFCIIQDKELPRNLSNLPT